MHRTLAHIDDEDERFAAIRQPPMHPRSGRRVRTPGLAGRRGTSGGPARLPTGEDQRDPHAGAVSLISSFNAR
ncbi:DUF6192 family protein [[Kitasatospora] papulosa]|uniref:DUF6192 family protein n=1 Tax=[Kitasatospora] papulosa TaxID=1464011 RepID=UPI003694768D